ncbi:DUF4347 domain-containing protein [Pantanalinema rosaneae CENA516]|uniref:DUF4347 domain-containing protein n=1 Tax=Pantanalinema rosaneae TaxID=1620701 RepID=UPI003D6DE000
MDLLSSSITVNRALSTAIATSPTPYSTSDVLQLTPQHPASSLVFIDSAVADAQFLAANLTAGSEVHFLDPMQNAIAQITHTLLGRENITSVHVLSHGTAGGLQLGQDWLNLTNLQDYAAQMQSWKSALTEDADILLYGCDVAQGELGQAFVQILSQLTGADVAASDDLTGNAAKGGNWVLEYQTGRIESSLAFQTEALATYQGILPQIGVAAFTAGAIIEGFEGLSPGTNVSASAVGAQYLIPGTSNAYTFVSGVTLTNPIPNPINASGVIVGDFARGSAGWGLLGNGFVTAATVPQGTAYLGLNQAGASYELSFNQNVLRVGGLITASSGSIELQAFDASNNLLETVSIASVNVNSWSSNFLGIQNTGGIRRIRFTGDYMVLDGLRFEYSEPPVVTLSGTALSYTENDAPILLDTGATIADSDSADFAGGTLTVRFASGGTASDRLTIESGGSVTLDGRRVLISGTQIGTYTGGFGTENLVISLNSAANATNVQTLLRAIAYSSTDERLSTTPTNRTVEVTLTDGDGGISTAVTTDVTVIGVNDAPIVGDRRVLYDGSLNTTPAAQGWLAVTPGSVETVGGGATTLNSTALLNLYAGYTRLSPVTLDATQGYVLSFQAQVNAENRNAVLGSGADKNGNGKFDRAGFSMLVVSSDNTRALELGFNLIGTNLQIWAQEDGTSQSNPSAQAGSVGDTNLLFTQAEGVTIANPGMGSYDVAIKGNTYTLFLNGNAILSGKLRNYTAATGPIDPYETPNLIFFGDNTTSASGSFSLASVGVTVAGNIPDRTTLEDAPATVIPFGALDLESYTLPSFTATSPNALVASATVGGSGIARTLSLTPAANAFGIAAVQLDGSDGALTATANFNFTILSVNDQPDTTPGANQTAISGAGAQTVANWATFTPGPANESGQTAIYTIVSNDNPGLFSVGPAIDASGNLTYTPAVGITTPQTATLTYRVQDSGGTANAGVDLSDVRSFTITINPPTIALTAPNSIAAEGSTDTGIFRISRGSVIGGDLMVNLTIDGSSTASAADYTFSNNVSGSGSTLTVTIPDGQRFVDVVLTPILDAIVEGTETLTLSLATGSYGIDSEQATASVDITDAPVLSITALDVTATELPGNPGTFRITRTGDTSQDMVVNYTIDGTATNSIDYATLTGTATIAAGQSFVDVTLAPVNDNIVEGSETVVLTLAAGDYVISATNTATVDIIDAPIVTVSVPDASASESAPNSGRFRLTRSGDTSQTLTVNYTIAGTATNGSDYTTLTGIATIAAGQSFVDVLVNPINDTIAEGDETIQLSLATGNYNLGGTTSGTVTILANDPTIRITPVTVSQFEGNIGSSNYTFTVELSNPSDEVITVNYATADGTATTADNDYIANSGTLIFNPGVTSQTITIAVNGDTKVEADETFQVNLSAATNGTLSTTEHTATGLIVNDDAMPIYNFSTANYRTLEGDGLNTILLAITRSDNLSQAASVQVQLSNGSAIAGRDFVGGVITVSFAAGQAVAYLPVQILGNRQSEPDKTLHLSLVGLSEVGHYGGQAQASLTIVNDDPSSRPIFRKGKGRSGIKVKKPKHRKVKRRK